MYRCEFLDRAYPLLLLFYNEEAIGSVRIEAKDKEKWMNFIEKLNEPEKSDVQWLTK